MLFRKLTVLCPVDFAFYEQYFNEQNALLEKGIALKLLCMAIRTFKSVHTMDRY